MENNEHIRRPASEELLLIEYLAQKAQYTLKPDWQQAVWAEPITEERNGDEHVSCGNSNLVVIVKCMKLILYGLLTILLDDWARVGHAGKAGTYE